MTGKEKCAVLKSIRRDIAKANDIPLDIPECTHKGDCPGTCPRCESEVKTLERALDKRRSAGFKVAIAGISAGLIALNTASCELFDRLTGNTLQGDVMMESTDGALVEVATPGELPYEETDPPVIEGDLRVVDTDTCEVELQGDMPVEGIN
ncbi:MAG: hypothetical protein E7632_13150 [Ruminococcaceae bacterium]|nr:hypothetical protein [Oscillospiraceae bacterium]